MHPGVRTMRMTMKTKAAVVRTLVPEEIPFTEDDEYFGDKYERDRQDHSRQSERCPRRSQRELHKT